MVAFLVESVFSFFFFLVFFYEFPPLIGKIIPLPYHRKGVLKPVLGECSVLPYGTNIHTYQSGFLSCLINMICKLYFSSCKKRPLQIQCSCERKLTVPRRPCSKAIFIYYTWQKVGNQRRKNVENDAYMIGKCRPKRNLKDS